jgi:hypothetical protein
MTAGTATADTEIWREPARGNFANPPIAAL